MEKTHVLHKSRATTLLFFNEIGPFAIPYHSSPIAMAMQNLKKSIKILKLEPGNEALTDGRTLKRFFVFQCIKKTASLNEMIRSVIPFRVPFTPIWWPWQTMKTDIRHRRIIWWDENEMSLVTRKPVFEGFDQVSLKPACSAPEIS